MKTFYFSLIILAAVLGSCSKKDETCNLNDSNISASAAEIASLQTYLSSNGITATQHPSGFFYNQVIYLSRFQILMQLL